ncbi:MAG TPA: hypothetical protein VN642_08465 [Dongiaceae bacterium]|nr:hypothetical protein [Dongiaceae bacterium]
MSGEDDIRLELLFFSVGGVHFAVDSGQVAGIATYDGEQADDLFWFHEEMGYDGNSVSYHSPNIVTIRTGGVSSYRVIIDSMEDIAEFSQNDIRLFPPLLEVFSLRRGMWGVLPRHGRMVLLVDFKRLIREIRPDIN